MRWELKSPFFSETQCLLGATSLNRCDVHGWPELEPGPGASPPLVPTPGVPEPNKRTENKGAGDDSLNLATR